MPKNKILYIVVIGFFHSLKICLGQNSTGINTVSPNPHAALHINNSGTINQGLLIPRLNSSALKSSNWPLGLSSSDKGLIFYADDKDSIFYYTGSKWRSLASGNGGNIWSKVNSQVSTLLNNDFVHIGSPASGYNAMFHVRDSLSKSSILSENIIGGYGVIGIAIKNKGIGGHFEGGSIGVEGSATQNGQLPVAIGGNFHAANSDSVIGGYFSVTNSSKAAAIYAEADQIPFNYAAHFKGNVYVDGYFGVGRAIPGSPIDAVTSKLSRCIVGYNSNVLDLDGSSGIFGHKVSKDNSNTGFGVHGMASGNQVSGIGKRAGVYGEASGIAAMNAGIWGKMGTGADSNFAVYAEGDVRIEGKLRVTGNAVIAGMLSKGGGSFKIDHPDDPENKYLFHSFVESPDMMNVYNGIITTDQNGLGKVELPGYFQSLNKDFRYQITIIGKKGSAYISKEIKDNVFYITSDEPNTKISWQVTGIRQDPFAVKNRIVTEVDKLPGEKGKYMHPEVYSNRVK